MFHSESNYVGRLQEIHPGQVNEQHTKPFILMHVFRLGEETGENPMHIWGKHANSKQKGPSVCLVWSSNQRLSCWEVTVLFTGSPCCPLSVEYLKRNMQNTRCLIDKPHAVRCKCIAWDVSVALCRNAKHQANQIQKCPINWISAAAGSHVFYFAYSYDYSSKRQIHSRQSHCALIPHDKRLSHFILCTFLVQNLDTLIW